MPDYNIQRGIMAAKLESVAGVRETLAGANAFMAYNPKFDPDHKPNKRDPQRPTFSQVPQVPGLRSGKLSFGTDLVGAAAAGTAPFWGALAKAAALGETIEALTSVTYAPASATIPHITLARYIIDEDDSSRAKISAIYGARLNLKYTLEVGKPALLNWEGTGYEFDETDGDMPTNIPAPTVLPPKVLEIVITLDSTALAFAKLEIDLANKISLITNPANASGYSPAKYAGREPKLTIDPLAVRSSIKDFMGLWRNASQVAFSIVLGTVAGNTHTLTAAKCQITDIKEQSRDNYLAQQFTVALNMNTSGDDEFSHVIT